MLFTAIADEMEYPTKYFQKLRTEHLKIINYGITHCQNKVKWRRTVVRLINTVTCAIVQGQCVAIDYTQDGIPISSDIAMR